MKNVTAALFGICLLLAFYWEVGRIRVESLEHIKIRQDSLIAKQDRFITKLTNRLDSLNK